jgi:hypothetical protein
LGVEVNFDLFMRERIYEYCIFVRICNKSDICGLTYLLPKVSTPFIFPTLGKTMS